MMTAILELLLVASGLFGLLAWWGVGTLLRRRAGVAGAFQPAGPAWKAGGGPDKGPAGVGPFPALRPLVLRLDATLRRTCHIFEFSPGGDCLFRLALGESRQNLVLGDGTVIRRGEAVGELHLWNEHVPPLAGRRSDLAWALAFRRQLVQSLRELAAYTQTDPRFAAIQAFRGEAAFGSLYAPGQLAKIAQRWGFEVVARHGRRGGWRRFADFWENLHARGLAWAYNPASLRGRWVRDLRRDQLWISRKTLLSRYAAAAVHGAGREVRRCPTARAQASRPEPAPQPASRGR